MGLNILIIGATGVIGKYITQQIVLAKSSFGRIAILTSKNTLDTKAPEIEVLKKEGVEVFVGDITLEKDVKSAYKDIDVVVSAVGRGAIATQIDLIKWASEIGINWFFPSEYGTDIKHNAASANEKPHQQKLKVRAFAETIKNLHFTYLVTGPYSDMFFAKSSYPAIGSYDVKAKKATLLGDGKGQVALTAMADVGKLVVASLQNASASKDKILIVNSFTSTPDEIIAEFEKQTGAKWDVSYTSLEKLKEIEKEAWDSGAPYATGATLRRIWTEGGTLYDKLRDNAVIGDPPLETLEDQVRQVIEKQSASGLR
ncbi:NmrA-like family-domain-containing protein [Bisporella sp. PMI_857]|nr:NmrA-like family-domain-containing protein [Bisporella sp. PMI_857]